MSHRNEIAVAEALPVRAFPNKFKPFVDRLKLARLILRELFHYRFNKAAVLSRPCIYGVFSGPIGGFWPIRKKCVGCLRCVQEYPDMCKVEIDGKWKRLGDSYFDAEAVTALNFEATTGRILVKGVGYKGRFSGEGFDSMWTDMSEIVRPTRDGIYGREKISTAVDVGRKPVCVAAGAVDPPVVELPLPMIFDDVSPACRAPGVQDSIAEAARRLGTLFVRAEPPKDAACLPYWIPLLTPGARGPALPSSARLVEFMWGGDLEVLEFLKRAAPKAVFCARLALNPRTFERIRTLFAAGIGAFHVTADFHGRELGEDRPRHIKDAVLGLHRALVREGIRDELTLIASGGIVRAEHVAKQILCGADLVALDTAPLVALQGEFNGDYTGCGPANLVVRAVRPDWGAQRVVNFCASWRDQLLEIASAMGIRDIRRMRGETGRAMFVEQLEEEWLK